MPQMPFMGWAPKDTTARDNLSGLINLAGLAQNFMNSKNQQENTKINQVAAMERNVQLREAAERQGLYQGYSILAEMAANGHKMTDNAAETFSKSMGISKEEVLNMSNLSQDQTWLEVTGKALDLDGVPVGQTAFHEYAVNKYGGRRKEIEKADSYYGRVEDRYHKNLSIKQTAEKKAFSQEEDVREQALTNETGLAKASTKESEQKFLALNKSMRAMVSNKMKSDDDTVEINNVEYPELFKSGDMEDMKSVLELSVRKSMGMKATNEATDKAFVTKGNLDDYNNAREMYRMKNRLVGYVGKGKAGLPTDAFNNLRLPPPGQTVLGMSTKDLIEWQTNPQQTQQAPQQAPQQAQQQTQTQVLPGSKGPLTREAFEKYKAAHMNLDEARAAAIKDGWDLK